MIKIIELKIKIGDTKMLTVIWFSMIFENVIALLLLMVASTS